MSKTKRKKNKEPDVSLCERSQFESIVKSLSDMLKQGAASFRFRADIPILLRDDEKISEAGLTFPVEKSFFYRIVRTEIASLLALFFSSHPEHLLYEVIPDEILNQEGLEYELKERLEIVREYLVSNNLRRRFIVYRTAKNSFLRAWDWDVSTKNFDFDRGKIDNISYATIRMSFDSPAAEGNNVFASDAPLGLQGTTKTVVFDCHLEDVRQLIADLELLEKKLADIEGEPSDA
jgi:hypothetical protein